MKKTIITLMLALVLCTGAATAESSLPEHAYPGNDPVEAAVANYLAGSELAAGLSTEEGSVTIPAPVILRIEPSDEEHLTVYGNFWVFTFVQKDDVLHTISGSEAPGVMSLEKSGDGWTVTGLEVARDGEDYPEDIRRFCAGDKQLEEAYFASSDAKEDPAEDVIRRYIRDYVNANALPVTAYQDPYWPIVPLEGEAEGNQIIGGIKDGAYELRIPLTTGKTEWKAIIPEEATACLTLDKEGTEDGAYVARFVAASDGSATVYVGRFEHGACQELHGFELLTAEGAVKESTGGSYTAAPHDEDLDPYLTGSWLEAETQFTQLSIVKNPEAGWDITVISPVSHGSWRFQATMYYDCLEDCLVYHDGRLADILPETSEAASAPVAENIAGKMLLCGDKDGESLTLRWESGLDSVPTTVFTRAEE